MKNRMIATESFRSGKDIYFFDYMEAVNGRHYLRIARMENCPDGPSKKTKVVIFEDVIQPMIAAFAYLLHSGAYAENQEERPKDIREKVKEIRALRESMDPDMPLRERLGLYGAGTLTEHELVSLLLGLGTTSDEATHMADELFGHLGGNIAKLIGMTQADLCRMPGIGMAKCSVILAAMELGRRSFLAAPITGSPVDFRYSQN
ncbi:UPF0758 domain-containing protein [Pedobacter sp. 22226]|uniref:UPF0758 domain-containing protein n=1 Tax=Pedobacter sp. 22226 TaxID=3453894 RepID=UPI003F865824